MDEFASATGIQWQGTTGVVEYGNDRSMIAMFYRKPVHQPGASLEQGRPIYEDKVYVRIHPPGERLNIVDRPVQERDKQRFPMQWAQFQQNTDQVQAGTPVSLLYPDHPSIAAMLRANNVFTIEQVANLSGPAIDSIGMGAQRYVNDAAKFLEMANKGMAATQVRAELEQRDGQIRTQQRQIDDMAAEIRQLRTQGTQTQDLAQLQTLLANVMARPQYSGAKQMPPAFDAATSQINATHGSIDPQPRQIQRRSRTRVK